MEKMGSKGKQLLKSGALGAKEEKDHKRKLDEFVATLRQLMRKCTKDSTMDNMSMKCTHIF